MQVQVPELMKKYNSSPQYLASYWLGNDFPVLFPRGLHSQANVRQHETLAYKRASRSIRPLLASVSQR